MRRGRRPAGLSSADVDSVLSPAGPLLPAARVRAARSPKSPTQTTTATLSRLVPHLSNEKKLAKAARVLTEVLKQAPLTITGRTAADRARCQALKTADSGALRDAIALSLNGGRSSIVHAKPLRPTYAALFEAALDRCVPGQLPDNIQAEVALWALVCPYNSALGDSEKTTLREDLTISIDGSCILRRCSSCWNKAAEADDAQRGWTRRGAAESRLDRDAGFMRCSRWRRRSVLSSRRACRSSLTTNGEDGARALFESAAAQARDDGVCRIRATRASRLFDTSAPRCGLAVAERCHTVANRPQLSALVQFPNTRFESRVVSSSVAASLAASSSVALLSCRGLRACSHHVIISMAC